MPEPFRQLLLFRTVRPADDEVGPVMAGIDLVMTVLIKYPFAVRRPACPEKKMVGMSVDTPAVRAVYIGYKYTVRHGIGHVKRQLFAVRTETDSIGVAIALVGDFYLVGAVQVHAEYPLFTVNDRLREDPFVTGNKQAGYMLWRRGVFPRVSGLIPLFDDCISRCGFLHCLPSSCLFHSWSKVSVHHHERRGRHPS